MVRATKGSKLDSGGTRTKLDAVDTQSKLDSGDAQSKLDSGDAAGNAINRVPGSQFPKSSRRGPLSPA
eukprot:318488-Alexandrium_andersonii.AAC.1